MLLLCLCAYWWQALEHLNSGGDSSIGVTQQTTSTGHWTKACCCQFEVLPNTLDQRAAGDPRV